MKVFGFRVAREEDRIIPRVKAHLKRNGPFYLQTGLLTGAALLSSSDIVHAAGIDAGGEKIYRKVVAVGKWVIIIKGGIETIQNVSNGDLQSAKSKFFQYLIVYGVLFALPWGLNEVENVFEGEGGLSSGR